MPGERQEEDSEDRRVATKAFAVVWQFRCAKLSGGLMPSSVRK
jgi:hypothetical protein